MSNKTSPILFDTRQKTRQREKVAHTFETHDFLRAYLVPQILERFEALSLSAHTSTLLDWGCHSGTLMQALRASMPEAQIVGAEYAPGLLAIAREKRFKVIENRPETPLSEAYYDSILSLMALQWVNNLPLQFNIFLRALKPDGYFLAALPGGGSFARLRGALMEAETDILGGASPRLSPLPGLKDCGRLLQRSGFTEIAVDRTELILRYKSVLDGLKDFKRVGEQAAFVTAPAHNLSRRILKRAEDVYKERYADLDGKLPARLEIIWLKAKRPSN